VGVNQVVGELQRLPGRLVELEDLATALGAEIGRVDVGKARLADRFQRTKDRRGGELFAD